MAVLKYAKIKGGQTAGFQPNNRIHWDLLNQWIEQHKQEIDNNLNDTLDWWKKENYKKQVLLKSQQEEINKRDLILRDLEIARQKRETIDPAKLIEFLRSFGSALTLVFSSMLNNLQSKCPGNESIIDKEVRAAMEAIVKKLKEWKGYEQEDKERQMI